MRFGGGSGRADRVSCRVFRGMPRGSPACVNKVLTSPPPPGVRWRQPGRHNRASTNILMHRLVGIHTHALTIARLTWVQRRPVERCEQSDRPVATRARGRGRTGRSEGSPTDLTPGSAHCTGKPRGTETSAEVLVGPPWRIAPNAGQQQWYGGYPCTPDGGPMGHSARSTVPPPPSASSVGVGRRRGSTWVRQFSPP